MDLKPAYDILKDFLPIEKLRGLVAARMRRRQKLHLLSPEFVSHSSRVTNLMDYFSWLEESREWAVGDGELLAMSFREMTRWWADEKLYRPYDGALRSFVLRGGTVQRIMVVEEEFLLPAQQLCLLKTCMRHKRLGMPPLMIKKPDTYPIINELGVKCDLFGFANNRIAYYNLFTNDEALCVKTRSKPHVAKAYATFQRLKKAALPFDLWLRRVHFKDRVKEIAAEVEYEVQLLDNYAKL